MDRLHGADREEVKGCHAQGQSSSRAGQEGSLREWDQAVWSGQTGGNLQHFSTETRVPNRPEGPRAAGQD